MVVIFVMFSFLSSVGMVILFVELMVFIIILNFVVVIFFVFICGSVRMVFMCWLIVLGFGVIFLRLLILVKVKLFVLVIWISVLFFVLEINFFLLFRSLSVFYCLGLWEVVRIIFLFVWWKGIVIFMVGVVDSFSWMIFIFKFVRVLVMSWEIIFFDNCVFWFIIIFK